MSRPRLDGLTAVVLAGGRGTRLAPLIPDVPKPLVEVAGRPFLHWLTSWLNRQGVSDFVFSAGHLGHRVEAWAAALRLPDGATARCRRERTPLGTGGAVLGCLSDCQDLVLVVNGDTLVLADIAPLIARLRADRLDGMLIAIAVTDASRFGTLVSGEDGLLRSFGEKRPGAGLVNGGIYLFPRTVLEALLPIRPVSLELDLVPELLARGARIGVADVERPFIDIGTPEALSMADAFITANGLDVDGPGRRPEFTGHADHEPA